MANNDQPAIELDQPVPPAPDVISGGVPIEQIPPNQQLGNASIPGTASQIANTVSPAQQQMAQAFGQTNNLANLPMFQSSLNPNQFTQEQLANLEAQKGLTNKEAQNQAQAAADAAKIQVQTAQEQQRMLADQQAAMQKSMQDANTRDENIRSMVKDQYSKDIDPNRFWNSKSTGQKAEAMIGILLSGIGMGIAHRPGENPAMGQLNKLIDQDIDSQKFNMDKNFKAISALHNLDESAFNRDMHNQLWQNNFRTAALERMKLDLQVRAAQSSSETIKNNAQKSILDITNEQDKLKYQNYLLAQKTAQQGIERLRSLQAQANKDIQELVKEKGVDPEEATKQVLDRPGMEPVRNQMLKDFNKQFNDELSKNSALTGVLGKDAQDRLQLQIQNQIFANNPQFRALLPSTRKPGEPIVSDTTEQKKVSANSTELNNDLDQLHNFMKDAGQINTDLFQGMGLGEKSQKRKQMQEAYQSFVYKQVAKMYKIDTSANEPRNLEYIHQLSAPYLPQSTYEDLDVTKQRMFQLWNDMQRSAQSTVPGLKIETPPNIGPEAPKGETSQNNSSQGGYSVEDIKKPKVNDRLRQIQKGE